MCGWIMLNFLGVYMIKFYIILWHNGLIWFRQVTGLIWFTVELYMSYIHWIYVWITESSYENYETYNSGIFSGLYCLLHWELWTPRIGIIHDNTIRWVNVGYWLQKSLFLEHRLRLLWAWSGTFTEVIDIDAWCRATTPGQRFRLDGIRLDRSINR